MSHHIKQLLELIRFSHTVFALPPAMLAAVMAGLGTRSLAANIILNPKYGLLYYSASITTLPLVYDEMLEQNVCPAPMCVQLFRHSGKTPCMAACPADDGGCLDGKIDDDGQIEDSYFDRERCVTRSMNFGINSFQKALTDIVLEEDQETRHMMVDSDFFARSCGAISFFKESVAQCFECMRVCPIATQAPMADPILRRETAQQAAAEESAE